MSGTAGLFQYLHSALLICDTSLKDLKALYKHLMKLLALLRVLYSWYGMFRALIACARAGGNNIFSTVSHQLGRELGKRDLPSPVLALPDHTSSVIQGENRTVRIDLGASGKMKSLCLDLCIVPVERS